MAAGYSATIVGSGVTEHRVPGSVGMVGKPLVSSLAPGQGVSVSVAPVNVVKGGEVSVPGPSASVLSSAASKGRSLVWMEVSVKSPTGVSDTRQHVVMELFDDVVPRTARNFRELCSGTKVSVCVVCCVCGRGL